MSWIDTSFEKAMKALFENKMEKVKADELFGQYTAIRNAMEQDNFLDEIKGKEPNLSDHSAKHLQDVFERSFKVIGKDEFEKFDVHNIYCLALMILFHDVGNIFGRDGHNAKEKVAEIYNQYRSNPASYRDERRVVTTGASAHSGISKSGNNDTLKDVVGASIRGNKIDLCELAAILRFSDELAEGKQRTCAFLLEKKLIEKNSEVYHRYAQITDIEIDRNLERISITYDIDIPVNFDAKAQMEFKELMVFTYYRAVKLDIERRYTKYYSEILKSYKFVTVQYNFTIGDIPVEIELGQITFEDRYPVPGEEFVSTKEEAERLIVSKNSDYDVDKLIKNINSLMTV